MCEHAHIWIAAHHMDEVYGIIMPAAFLALSSAFWWTLWQYAEYGFSISCSWKKNSSTLALTVLYVNMLMVQLLLTTWVKLLRIMPSRTLLPAAVLALSLGFWGPNSSTSKSWSSITFGGSGKFWSHALLCSIRHTMITLHALCGCRRSPLRRHCHRCFATPIARSTVQRVDLCAKL